MFKSIAYGLILVSFLTSVAHSASDSEYLQFIESNGAIVLETYRVPQGKDLSYWGVDRDSYFYKSLDSDSDKKAPYWTKGHFNDDSLPDYIYILFHRKLGKAYLIGFISSESGYTSTAIEPSSKNMAVETRKDIVGHYNLEGQGHGLSWVDKEARFIVIP
jgi:hypothetical protein